MSFRPDDQWRLISYPYYIKYTVPEKSTVFKHINLNVRQFLNDRRKKNTVQKSILIDNENKSNYTIIISKLHRHMRTWWIKVKKRDLISNN